MSTVGLVTSKTVLGALTSERSRRATFHVLAGLPAAVGAATVLTGVFVLWGAAVWSLFDGPIGGLRLIGLYVATAVCGPVVFLWCVLGLGALQRARFRGLLGVSIPAPARVRLVRAWRGPAVWRQLGYHLLSFAVGGVGGAVVVFCWSALLFALWARGSLGLGLAVASPFLFFAAPWAARGVARADEAAARTLLGPGRAEELRERVESLARSRADAVAAADAERRRIERDLHDGAQQRLVSLAMNLGMARAKLTSDPSDPARLALEQAHDEATEALAELREFVRGLHPAVLDDRGLDAALSGIVARAPLPVRLRVDLERRCSATIEAIAYFVVSEALTNIAKHANAGRAEVTVGRTGDRLRVVVTDDGRGGAVIGDGSGLRGLAQRAATVDGTLTVHSPPGGPTTITVELPCES